MNIDHDDNETTLFEAAADIMGGVVRVPAVDAADILMARGVSAGDAFLAVKAAEILVADRELEGARARELRMRILYLPRTDCDGTCGAASTDPTSCGCGLNFCDRCWDEHECPAGQR